ncbi:MAG: hypothetical protein AAGF28_08490 [Pseudomonadota bacterium]
MNIESLRGPKPNDNRGLLGLLGRRCLPLWVRASRWRSRLKKKPYVIWLLTAKPRASICVLTETWINKTSAQFHAQTTRPDGKIDVIWVFEQDPLSPERIDELRRTIDDQPECLVLNAPEHYNFYHSSGCFEALQKAGVSVAQEVTEADAYNGLTVYKKIGEQNSEKWLADYTGPKSGFRAFRFVDTKWRDGHYRRFRLFYVFGWVRSSKVFLSKDWNVCVRTTEHLFYGFEVTDKMAALARAIHEASKIDYFALDLLVREEDGEAFCVDINVFPRVWSLGSTNRAARRFLPLHTFAAREALGMDEPDGIPAGTAFDQALLSRLGDQ